MTASRSQELTIPAPPDLDAPPSLAANWRPLVLELARRVPAGLLSPRERDLLRQLERMAKDGAE